MLTVKMAVLTANVIKVVEDLERSKTGSRLPSYRAKDGSHSASFMIPFCPKSRLIASRCSCLQHRDGEIGTRREREIEQDFRRKEEEGRCRRKADMDVNPPAIWNKVVTTLASLLRSSALTERMGHWWIGGQTGWLVGWLAGWLR